MRSRCCGQTYPADGDYRARFDREADLASSCGIPTSSACTTAARTTASCGSRWTTSTVWTRRACSPNRYPAGMPADQVMKDRHRSSQCVGLRAQAGTTAPRRQTSQHHAHRSRRRREQRILLADFGIARNVGDISGLTATNMTVGTVAYAAPEQLMARTSMAALTSTRWLPPPITCSPDHSCFRTPTRRSSSAATSTHRLRPWRTLVPNSRHLIHSCCRACQESG